MTTSKSPHAAKASAFRAAMKNKETRAMIFKALKSPYGSPKSKTAARTLRIIARASGVQDGQGGVGTGIFSGPSGRVNPVTPFSNVPQGALSGITGPNVQPPDPGLFSGYGFQSPLGTSASGANAVTSPLSVVGGIDDLLLGGGSGSQPNKFAGQFFPQQVTTPGAITQSPSGQYTQAPSTTGFSTPGLSLPAPRTGATVPTPAPTPNPAPGKFTPQKESSLSTKVPPQTTVGAETARNGAYTQGEADSFYLAQLRANKFDVAKAMAETKTKTNLSPSVTIVKSTNDQINKARGTNVPVPDATEPTKDVKTEPGITSFYDANDFNKMVSNAITGKGTDDIVNFMSELEKSDPDMAKRVRPVYDAVMAETGAQSLIFGALSGDETLKTSFGLTDEMIAQMPFDLLSGPKLEKLRSMARLQTNLDNYEAQLDERTTSHLYAEKAFTDYVRDKDQFLGKVDKLIHDYDDFTVKQDRSDPMVRQQMDNYKSFLQNIRGGIRQRYTNLIADSVTQENADYQRMKLRYDAKKSETDKLYEGMVSGTDKAWTTTTKFISDALQEQYKSLEERKGSTMNEVKGKIELASEAQKFFDEIDPVMKGLKLKEQTAQTELAEAKLANEKAGGSDASKEGKPFSPDTLDKFTQFEKDKDDKPASITVVSPSQIWTQMKGFEKTQPMTLYAQQIRGIISANIGTDGNFVAVASPYITAGNDLTSIPEAERDTMQGLYASGILTGIKNGIVKYLEENSSAVAKAVNELNKGKIQTVEEFKKNRNAKNVSEDILDALWNLHASGTQLPTDMTQLSATVYAAVEKDLTA